LFRWLTSAEFCRDDRLLAWLGVFRKMILHAGLDVAATGLNAWAGSLYIGLTGFDDCDTTQKSLFAEFRERGEALLDASSQPPVAGLNPGAMLLNLGPASLTNRRPLCHGAG
jgi:hypothetical protein